MSKPLKYEMCRHGTSLTRSCSQCEQEAIKPEDDTLILEVRLASGRFSSSIQVPLFASSEEKERFVEAWCNLMEAGIKCGQSARENKK